MPDTLLSVVSEAERRAFPTLSHLSENDVDSIWANVSSFVEKQMSLQKGVHIVGLGTFTFSQQKLDMGNKLILLQRPIFLLSEKLLLSHGLKQTRPLAAAEDVPVVPLNHAALSAESPFERDAVEGCVRETLLLLLRAVAGGRVVLFTFQGVGVLCFRHGKVKMKFYRDFISSMDGSGRLLWALSNSPCATSLLSGRMSSLRRPATITPQPPRTSHGEEGSQGGLDRRTQVPPDHNIHQDNTGDITEEPTPRPDRPQYRQSLQTAKVNTVSLTEDLDTSPPAVVADRCSSSVCLLPGEGAVEEGRRGQSPLDAPCVNHNRAGQELCYLCMQRSQRNVPLYLQEERRREEQEENRGLLLHQQLRDQAYLQRERADRQKLKQHAQKLAAFNLGVADALKERKTNRSSQFHGSYIFGGRPPTPSRGPSQQSYSQQLREQAGWTREQIKHTQKDQDVLDRLQQAQLAQEIALQKTQQILKKHNNTKNYQRALDTQVADQGPGIPARQPDGAVFGLLDSTAASLANQRERAQRVYQEQLEVANRKMRAELDRRLTEGKEEREMLRRNRRELIADRISRFEHMRSLRSSLETTWSCSATLKHQRDRQERNFLRSHTGLLIDQCERYRRCHQCQKKTSNCGESNIWKSHCMLGTRFMV
ncbi:coiled-coil domain-containing protein 81-like [Osmerus mordax]|uniref:coiled-coil domain-containing protein 81-like n=1 Tax=Osmerus mordax TaxID=8014 RepID=UPI00351078C5